ncbi:glycoside hydrolase family 5 protein [Marasmius fiardii PR-910]|nr:glycoside hydrolase family 5 protein [Marasmius fiardii PR-910]
MHSFALLSLSCALASLVSTVSAIPDKIYGVNLGSWLVLEPWMLPAEWLAMGGQDCANCQDCIRDEFSLAKAFPTTVDAKFDKHWNTWFNQSDVDQLVRLKINTVRIPLGYWIIEQLVDRKTEFFPRGGLKQLRRGLSQLKRAGIEVILDHHALPGVQAVNQMFTGRCTDNVQFYTNKNYQRALTWTTVMTTLAHTDPEFSTVFAIEAVNEPIMDASMTPGYGQFQKDFVNAVRLTEAALGISTFDPPVPGLPTFANTDFQTAFSQVASNESLNSTFTPQVLQAMADAVPIIMEIARDVIMDGSVLGPGGASQRQPLVTNFMDVNWQNNNPPNPADAAKGPIGFDNHLYYVFGGVADPNPNAYLTSICNLKRVENDAALRNTPLWFGEWGLPTQFDATDDFLTKWADAQKIAYTKGKGWIFWNFKIEISQEAGDLAREWSYFEGVRRGYLTQDPSQVKDPHVCDSFIQN